MQTTIFPRNPALIHRIQDKLMKLNGATLLMEGGILGASILSYAKVKPDIVIKFLYETWQNHPEQVINLIGKECMKDIEEYMQGGTEDDLGDLFQSPGLCRDTEGSIGIGC